MALPYISLKNRQDFLRMTKYGHKIVMPTFVLQVLARSSTKKIFSTTHQEQRNDMSLMPHIGFTASKKIGNAVIRNKARRRLKAAVAQHLKENDSFPIPLDFVLIARHTTPTVLFAQIIEDLKKAFVKVISHINQKSSGTTS